MKLQNGTTWEDFVDKHQSEWSIDDKGRVCYQNIGILGISKTDEIEAENYYYDQARD